MKQIQNQPTFHICNWLWLHKIVLVTRFSIIFKLLHQTIPSTNLLNLILKIMEFIHSTNIFFLFYFSFFPKLFPVFHTGTSLQNLILLTIIFNVIFYLFVEQLFPFTYLFPSWYLLYPLCSLLIIKRNVKNIVCNSPRQMQAAVGSSSMQIFPIKFQMVWPDLIFRSLQKLSLTKYLQLTIALNWK